MKRSIIYHALIIALLIFGCAKKPTSPSSDNPFDPENPYTGGDPLGLTAAPLNEGIMLCWNKPAFPSLTGYKLYRSFDEDSLQYNLLAQLQDTVYLDSTITRGYRYFYLVTALSNQGESISSNILPVEVSSVPYMVIDSDNQYTPAMIVTLDILAVYADSMRLAVSPAGSIDESVWETYQSARICTLSADTTAHWIDFQVLYSDGELSPVVRDSIAPHPMYANIIIGDGSGYTNTSPVEFRIVESGALNIMLSEDPAFSGAQWENITQVNSFNLSQGDGLKTIYVKLSNDYFVKDTVCAVTYDTFAEIESVSHDGAGRVLEYGDTLLISLTIIGGESGGECSVDIIDTTGAARSNIALEDKGGGLYQSLYVINLGDDINDGYLDGHFNDRAGNQAASMSSASGIDIAFWRPGMAFVPAGYFPMGYTIGEADEKPVHAPYISDFWISVYEVTNAEFAEFLNAGYSTFHHDSMAITLIYGGDYQAVDSLADHPVTYIDWYGAQAYAEWRVMRLPTEAEWEKAARGIDQRRYPWGPIFMVSASNNFLNSNDPWEPGTTPAGFFNGEEHNGYLTFSDASPYDCHDMDGNVGEWCSDWYKADFYSQPGATFNNPTGPSTGSEKVVRSPSWSNFWIHCYAANRFKYPPGEKRGDVGIRLAVNP